ncbi:MAG TPA: DsrE family protein [Candidatus Sulfotelmatobacter sp.]|nr:DsrE family protein [Candidatus Sulfotelmatobacter sp.]
MDMSRPALNLKAATGDVADDLLAYLQEYEVPIYAGTPCAKARQISETDLIKGASLASATKMIDMACESAVISL